MVRYPPLVLSFTQPNLCDTRFCNVSRDNCAIPPQEQARKSFAILSLQVLRDMKSIAIGPPAFQALQILFFATSRIHFKKILRPSRSADRKRGQRKGVTSKNVKNRQKIFDIFRQFSWRVPNPPGANPLVAERVPWRSSQSRVIGGQQPIRNPYRFLSFLLHTWQPLCNPNSQSWGRPGATRGLAPGWLGTRQCSRRAKTSIIVKKVSKAFSTLFDNFRAAPVFRPPPLVRNPQVYMHTGVHEAPYN